MLIAATQQHHEVLAEEVEWEDGPFFCPSCQAEVVLKSGRIKVPHFAHLPDTECAHAGRGESDEHRAAKREIYRALEDVPGVSKLMMERPLGEVRPDISFALHGKDYIAIEVQISTLSPDDIERRTLAYARKNIAVLWTPPLPLPIFEPRYAPKEWERYLHGLYFGRVYYWLKNLELVPVVFEEYMIAPSRYSNERRSKRFVTPKFLPKRLIPELSSVWRSPWRSYPRAKLWCEPSKPQE